MDGHAIIIPTYNERENISLLIDEILDLGLDSQVIIVDDNSPDGTGELADELAAQHPGVRVIHRSGKRGLGTAHIAGVKAALSASARTIRTMDADFSHHPRYIPGLLAALEQFDVVIDSRYVPGLTIRTRGTRSTKSPTTGPRLSSPVTASFWRSVALVPRCDTTFLPKWQKSTGGQLARLNAFSLCQERG